MSIFQVDNFEVPLLLLTFNRPKFVQKQLNSLRILKPNYLYIFSDGPREKNDHDYKNVFKSREILKKQIDWPCKIKYKFEEKNLGCGLGVSSAISWFFSFQEEGIIVEDDCILSQSFFYFAKEMLEEYRDNKNIAGITADYRLNYDKTSFYGFIPYPLIWGWATWKRSWESYSLHLDNYDENNLPEQIFKLPRNQKKYWIKNFNKIKRSEKPHTWDYQFSYLVLSRGQKFIYPFTNLVSNIGFDHNATHTKDAFDKFSYLKIGNIEKPYKIKENLTYTNFLSKELFVNKSLLRRIIGKLKILFFKKFKK